MIPARFTDPSTLLIRNHALWQDTDGQPIDCHEGCILRMGDAFYWYGRRYHGNIDGIFGREGMAHRLGFVCYRSFDLVNWSFAGNCLEYPADGWITQGTWHRPRILYCRKTHKYVLWFFALGQDGQTWWARDVVATAETPAGPFSIAGEPAISGVEGASGDHALFEDMDGQAYIAKGDWQRNGWMVKLTEDMENTTGQSIQALSCDPSRKILYEGVCIARYKGKYIYAASGVVGLNPSDTSYAIADTPMGPYRLQGLMSQDKTWQSQISSFYYIAESDCLMALCDQWLIGPDGKKIVAEYSCQLWLPITFNPQTGCAQMLYRKQWNPWLRNEDK